LCKGIRLELGRSRRVKGKPPDGGDGDHVHLAKRGARPAKLVSATEVVTE
jgi:hypothetical protein